MATERRAVVGLMLALAVGAVPAQAHQGKHLPAAVEWEHEQLQLDAGGCFTQGLSLTAEAPWYFRAVGVSATDGIAELNVVSADPGSPQVVTGETRRFLISGCMLDERFHEVTVQVMTGQAQDHPVGRYLRFFINERLRPYAAYEARTIGGRRVRVRKTQD